MPLEGASGGYQPLKFHAGHHVGKSTVSIFVQRPGIIDIHTGGHNNGSHIHVQDHILHIKIDAILLAGLNAFSAGNGILTQAGFS